MAFLIMSVVRCCTLKNEIIRRLNGGVDAPPSCVVFFLPFLFLSLCLM